MIRQYEDAPTHLRSLFSRLHPNVKDARTLFASRLPGEILSMEKGLAYMNNLLSRMGGQSMTFRSDAAGGMFEYTDGGVVFREVLLTGIVNMQSAFTWKNTRSLVFRAPAAEFDTWRAVFDVIRFSVRFNPDWILKESEGQRQRAEIATKVFDEIRRIDQEMLASTRVNREEIMNDNFLVLTGQEEYTNPITGETDVDTDAFRYRWVTSGGDIYYTDREDEDPNDFLQRDDYRRTPVRKRRNEQ